MRTSRIQFWEEFYCHIYIWYYSQNNEFDLYSGNFLFNLIKHFSQVFFFVYFVVNDQLEEYYFKIFELINFNQKGAEIRHCQFQLNDLLEFIKIKEWSISKKKRLKEQYTHINENIRTFTTKLQIYQVSHRETPLVCKSGLQAITFNFIYLFQLNKSPL